MIKSYDAPLESAILELLELLMAKASSYSWSSVRSFHGYIAKHVELWRLEWTSLSEICEKANTYFKHSDLRSSQLRPTIPSILSSPSVPPPTIRALQTAAKQQKRQKRLAVNSMASSIRQLTIWHFGLGFNA